MSFCNSAYAEPITIEIYNYLIAVPCMRKHLLQRRFENGQSQSSFIGNSVDHADMQRRIAYMNN